MAVGKGYVGFEPLFAVGVITAVSASMTIPHIYSAAAAVHAASLILSSILLQASRKGLCKTSFILLTLTALTTGLSIGLNGRLLSWIESPLQLTRLFCDLGESMKSVIDSLAFSNSDTNALLKALLCGDRSDLSKEVTSAFRTAGASHILALSGLHLGIIYSITDMITSVCGNSITSRQVRSLLNVGICTAYTFATGASASITRALLFITLREIGIVTGRPIKLDGLLWKCLLIHLVICPEDILDIGFQLSYAAIAGIAWIHPRLKGIWQEGSTWPVMRKIWESAALSISCQLTTAPLVWFHFRTFPGYFLLTNLLALPLTGLLIPVSILTVILDPIGICPEILTLACEKTVSCLTYILTLISQMQAHC